MGVKTIGRKQYEVDIRYLGHNWTYTLSGGLFATEEKAHRAGQEMAAISAHSLVTAEMIRTAMSHFDRLPSEKKVASANQHTQWMQRARIVQEFALIVPSQWSGFATGSNAVSENQYRLIKSFSELYRRRLINRAPQEATRESMDVFLEDWFSRTLEGSDFNTDPHDDKLKSLYNDYNRLDSVPALRSKSPNAHELLNAHVMNLAVAHIVTLLPVEPEPAKIIRGDRAASLMNLSVPKIQESLNEIPDPVERAALQDRLDRLASRVQIASANSDVARRVLDARLSLEVLEESVENRLSAVHSPEM